MKINHSKNDPVYKIAKQRVHALLKELSGNPSAFLTDELVHEVRICAKKLRALLQLYRPCRNKADIKDIEQLIKQIADSCSSQRDALVQFKLISQASMSISHPDEDDLQSLQQYFSNARQRTSRQNSAADLHARLENVLLRWKEVLESGSMPDLEQGLDFTYQKSAHTAKTADSDDSFHRCRKWSKYYLNQLRMLHSKKNAQEADYIQQLEALGELLGQFHDSCVLEKNLNQLLSGLGVNHDKKAQFSEMNDSVQLYLEWLGDRKKRQKTRCLELFKSVFVHKHNPVKV